MARNKLVIIGNGFDLAHGMKTGYVDFLKWYLNNVLTQVHQNPNQKYDDHLVLIHPNEIIPNIDSIEFEVHDFRSKLKGVGIRVEIKPFLEKLINRYQKFNELKWVDIECEYFSELCSLYRIISSSNIPPKSIYLAYQSLKDLNSTISYVKSKLIEYLAHVEEKEFLIQNNIEYIIKNLVKSVEMISPHTPMIDRDKLYFLNFNYTTTISNYLKQFSKEEYNYDVINIHGTLKEIDSVIFGYGDMMDSRYIEIENFNDNNLLKNIKQFYYLQSDGYHDLIEFIERNEPYVPSKKAMYEVFIMGHSCGLSDRILLNRIFNPQTCSKIKIYYDRNNENQDFFEKIQNISRHFDLKDKKYFIETVAKKRECEPLA